MARFGVEIEIRVFNHFGVAETTTVQGDGVGEHTHALLDKLVTIVKALMFGIGHYS